VERDLIRLSERGPPKAGDAGAVRACDDLHCSANWRREAERTGCGQLGERHVAGETIPSHRRGSYG
jgi:hypothetical protein